MICRVCVQEAPAFELPDGLSKRVAELGLGSAVTITFSTYANQNLYAWAEPGQDRYLNRTYDQMSLV